jgi:hypothetical protein
MDKTATKSFEINVKADNPSIGTITVDGVEDGRIILDQYEMLTEPSVNVTNAADYNGKLLTEGVQYTVTTKYEYATSKTATFNEVSCYTPSKAGVYRITKTVHMGEDVKEYTYLIYVASKYSNEVDFVENTSSIIINKEGYLISGDLSNVTGKLYSVAVYEGGTAPATTEDLIAMAEEQGTVREFRDDTISEQFTFDNSKAYTIYYAFTNLNGDITSGATPYTNAITVSNISTAAEFKAQLIDTTPSLTTIYMLTSDIDFENASVTGTTLSTVINGNGHTIKNIAVASTEKSSLFASLNGGTLMNVKFENLSFKNTAEKQLAAIFAESNGGYIYNVQITNIDVYASARSAAVVGFCKSGDTYIERVSVTNDAEHAIVGTDAGGIVGLIQDSDGAHVGVYISTCLVNSNIGSTTKMQNYAGGMVGRYSDRVAVCDLEVYNCIFTGTIYSATYAGGIVGAQQNGAGRLRVTLCLNAGTLYYNSNPVSEIVNAQKNCSGIMGRYNSSADVEVKNCFAKFVEYNTDYDVDVVTDLTDRSIWRGNMTKFDYENTWQLNYKDGDTTSTVIEAPYVTLKFIETTTEEAE